MDFTKTIRAIIVAAVIAAMALGMTAISTATTKGVEAREAAAILAVKAEAVEEAPQDQEAETAPAPEMQRQRVINPEEPVVERAAFLEPATEYKGIEPNHTEETLPERAGFTYYDGVDLDKVTQDFIFMECGEAAVNYELVLAIIIYESGCNPNAISETDDWGYMQINKCNHAWLAEQYGLTDMLDPHQNIIAGITILATLSRYDDGTDAGLHKVLMAYNLGSGGAAEAWARGTYSTAYSKTIMQIRDDLLCGKYTKGA